MNRLTSSVFLVMFFFWSDNLSAQIPDCVKCCCGNVVEVGVPGGNFEDPPYANPIIVYFAGQTYSTWTVNSGSIDLLGPNYLNWASGNPNGATQYIDLHGNNPGSFSTTLNGLNVNYEYTIVLWYAKNAGAASANCQIQVANGDWLNQTWTATNNGANGWLRKCFTFTAQASSAELSFTGTGPQVNGGVLLDDITMYSCPPKSIPEFTDLPDDVTGIQCVKDVPPPPVLTVQDDCDNNPVISLDVDVSGTPCNQIITRTWTAENSCGSTATAVQQVFVEDTEPPVFLDEPQDIQVDCSLDIMKEFTKWLNINGGATATDNCDPKPGWHYDYAAEPEYPCSETLVYFTVTDDCGNEDTRIAKFIVEDSEGPEIISPPQNVDLICDPDPYGKLIIWLNNHANATASDNCGNVSWSNDFDGNLTKTQYTINFTAADECGNATEFKADFNIKPGGQTIYLQKTSCDTLNVGTDTMIYKVNGCDSIVISNTVYAPADTTLISGITCNKSQELYDTLFYQNQLGCDSIVIQNIQYIKPDTTILQNAKCSIKTFSVDTFTYQGQYCDSLVLIQNIPLKSDTIFISMNTCDSTKTGSFTNTYQNQAGCDSIVITNVSFAGFLFSNQTVHECGILPDFTDTLIYQTAECDSFVYVHHIFHKPDTINLSESTCDINSTGITQTVYKNIWGCDSTVILNKYLLPSDTVLLSSNTCKQQDAGTFISKLVNQSGCDSIVIHTITYIKPDTSYINATTCDPTKTGISIQNFPTAMCDSTIITNTTLLPEYSITLQKFSCNVQQPGYDTLKLLTQYGCDSLIINELIPKPLEVYVKSDPVSCRGLQDGSILIDSVVNGQSPYQYSINGTDYYFAPEFKQLSSGNYSLFVKDAQGCFVQVNNLSIDEGSAFSLELGPDRSIPEGTSITLDPVYSESPYNIQWDPSGLFACPSCLSNTLTITSDQKVYLYAENQNGCPAIDSILLKAIPVLHVYIPDAFSPDFDGINDNFTIYGDHHLVRIKELNIFSRWGEHIFTVKNIEPNNPSLGWNGKSRNKVLDPAVFVYWAILEFDNGETRLYKGDVILIR